MSSTPPSGTKVCPVCDSSIDASAQRCPSCQTDLSLFDIGSGGLDIDEELGLPSESSIDEMLENLTGGGGSAEILETLKTVGKASRASGVAPEVTIAGPTTSSVGPSTGERFMCPICESPVDADATTCPGCGAHFEESDSAAFECPVCRASVPRDADRCASCGVQFSPTVREGAGRYEPPPPRAPEPPRRPPPLGLRATPAAPTRPARDPTAALRERLRNQLAALRAAKPSPPLALPIADRQLLHRELPKLVNEVRSLLNAAKSIGLAVDAPKRTISEAIAAGKRRDVERAVRMIGDARQALDASFRAHIGGLIEALLQETEVAGGTPEAASALQSIQGALANLGKRDYEAAWQALHAAADGLETQSRTYHEARDTIANVEGLLHEARGLGVPAAEIERPLRQARQALTARDDQEALRYARDAHDRIARDLDVVVHEELRKARQTLLDLKVRGADLSKPIGFLKTASVHVKKAEWLEALRYLNEFRRETGG